MIEKQDDRSGNASVQKTLRDFRKAYKKAGYPEHFKWDPKKGRIWTKEAMIENTKFRELSPEEQQQIIESRELKYRWSAAKSGEIID